ncbi:MAG: TonB-dependent receptor [Proteobacteria bacterium]|nr:TonB-dependent receptor [Pseudomonadota bacterium]
MTDVIIRNTSPGRAQKQFSKKTFVLTPLAAAMVVAMSPGAPALAQDNEAGGLEEIIVTATKRELNLQDVGQAIIAFSTADIEKMGIKSMEDYIAALPSVVLKSERPGRNDLVMRGVSEDANTWYVDSQVSLYLDEVPMTTSSQQVSVRAIDMQRIEALPGPQGTLFGASSQTGTIRMITNKPNHNGFSGGVEASFGSTTGGAGSYDINGHLNIPLIDDVLSVRIVGYSSHDGGYVDNVLGRNLADTYDNADVVEKDFNEYDVDGARIALLWDISDDWSLLASYIAENSDLSGSWETDPSLGRDNTIVRFIDEYRTDEWWTVGATLSGDLGFATMTATATHFERDITYGWDNTAYADWRMSYYGYGNYETEYNKSIEFNEQPQERETFELRLTSQGDGKLQWMAGVYWEDVWDYWYYGSTTENFVDTPAFAYAQYWACYYNYYYDVIPCPLAETDVNYVNILDRTVEQYSAFGELSYDLSDDLTMIVGARVAKIERDVYNQTHLPEGLPPFAFMDNNGVDEVKGDDQETLYKLSFNYNIDDDRMVYALFSQGFRVGGVNSQRAVAYAPDILLPEYDADYMDNYELGIKSTWLDNRLMINAQFFLMKWKDYQVTNYGDGDLPWWVYGNVNAGTAESKGIEFNINWQITDNLQIKSSFFAGHAQFTETVFAGTDEYRDGMDMPNSPDRKAYISFNYDIPNVLGGDLWLWYATDYTSETWNRVNSIEQRNEAGISPSRTMSNFQMGLDLPNNLSLTLQVDNVWDKSNYSWLTTSTYKQEWFGTQQGVGERSLTRPRTVWFVARKHF